MVAIKLKSILMLINNLYDIQKLKGAAKYSKKEELKFTRRLISLKLDKEKQ